MKYKAGLTVEQQLQLAFLQGAFWWEWRNTGSTMWASERKEALEEAASRLADGSLGQESIFEYIFSPPEESPHD